VMWWGRAASRRQTPLASTPSAFAETSPGARLLL
jgi:hypothetical protein